MWSLISPRAKGISGPEKFSSSPQKDFFNTIGGEAEVGSRSLLTAAFGGKAVVDVQTLDLASSNFLMMDWAER
jgi:hypothetical protein